MFQVWVPTMCECPGEQFGSHFQDCPERYGKYGMRFRRVGTCWPCVAFVVLGVTLFYLILR